jgi:hypothetical protein
MTGRKRNIKKENDGKNKRLGLYTGHSLATLTL